MPNTPEIERGKRLGHTRSSCICNNEEPRVVILPCQLLILSLNLFSGDCTTAWKENLDFGKSLLGTNMM